MLHPWCPSLHRHYLGLINIIGALTNVFLNLLLIPCMGVMGAALASLVTQFLTNVVLGFIIKPIGPNNRLMIKSLSPIYLKEMLNYMISARARNK